MREIRGTQGRDSLVGDAGEDWILGLEDADTLDGGAGNDALEGGDGNDILIGGVGGDVLRGGNGVDWAYFNTSAAGINVNLGLGTAHGGDAEGDTLFEIERVFGSIHNDVVVGDTAGNYLRGNAGNDTIAGGDGNDFVQGDAGADILNGGNGNDWAYYAASTAGVTVNLGNASLNAGGDAEGDTFISIENVFGSVHADHITGTSGANHLRGRQGDDILYGDGGVDYLQGDDGADQHFGGSGNDWALYISATAGVTVNFTNPGLNTGEAAGDTYDSVEYIRGSGFADDLTGDAQSNYIRGNNGNDVIRGEAGADFLAGENGADALFGGAGVDWAYYRFSSVGVTVDLGANAAFGGEAEGDTFNSVENVFGSEHTDVIRGDNANNLLRGRSGDDILTGNNGNDFLLGDAGADAMDGGAGSDWAYYTTAKTALTVNLADASLNTGTDAIGDTYVSIENIYGGPAADILIGDANNNTIRGNLGNDAIYGGDGNDIIYGEAGADAIDGGNGVDWAYYLTSDAAVTINLATNTATGGDAQGDTFTAIERVFGSRYDDVITGDANANYLRGYSGNDTLDGGLGDDFLQGDAGADALDGGDGIDWAHYASSTSGQTINLDDAAQNAGTDAAGDTYVSIENVLGSSHDDIITGDAAANILDGGSGNDQLNGGAGDDILRGRLGADALDGGDGSDWADYSGAADAHTVNLADSTQNIGTEAAGDTYVSVENVLGTAYNDVLTGNADANTLVGQAGTDTLTGGAGDDILNGGLGADALDGGDGFDWADYSDALAGQTIDLANANRNVGTEAAGDTYTSIENAIGSQYADAINGDSGANHLVGLDGNDVIDGGWGDDILDGGEGRGHNDGRRRRRLHVGYARHIVERQRHDHRFRCNGESARLLRGTLRGLQRTSRRRPYLRLRSQWRNHGVGRPVFPVWRDRNRVPRRRDRPHGKRLVHVRIGRAPYRELPGMPHSGHRPFRSRPTARPAGRDRGS